MNTILSNLLCTKYLFTVCIHGVVKNHISMQFYNTTKILDSFHLYLKENITNLSDLNLFPLSIWL